MLLLALDSTAVAASVCLMEDGVILAESYQNTKQTHSQTLMPMVQFVLQCARRRVDDLDPAGRFGGARIVYRGAHWHFLCKGIGLSEKHPLLWGVGFAGHGRKPGAYGCGGVCRDGCPLPPGVSGILPGEKRGSDPPVRRPGHYPDTAAGRPGKTGRFLCAGGGWRELVHAGAGTCGPFVAAGTGTVAHAAGQWGGLGRH